MRTALLSKKPNQMIVRKNPPRTVYPHVNLGKKRRSVFRPHQKKRRPLLTEEEMRDKEAYQHFRRIRPMLGKGQDGQRVFFLLADFFQCHPVETLGPRSTRDIAMVLSRSQVTLSDTMALLDLLEMALSLHRKAEMLCEKLKHVGFSQDKKGLKRANNLHLVIRCWEKSLLKEKRIHGLAA